METIDPEDLRRRLAALAGNLAYGWRHEMRTPFVLLDEAAFDRAHHSPRAMLAKVGDEMLRKAGTNPQFLESLALAERALREESGSGGGWWSAGEGDGTDMLVAYFSTEFGVDESLPIYSGGLGVLAGDHLKASSELGLPLIGVGLLYKHGYFRQRIDEFGAQQERYPVNDPADMPLSLMTDASGLPLLVEVELAGEPVRAKVWRARVGRIRLYLLDTDVEGNSAWGRRVTDSLYGGDREQRIRQEILLGIGGVRALRALGLNPTVWHMNEGHAAFMQFERLRELRSMGLGFDEALERLRASTVFTTHTPVPAGNEVFDPELVRRYLGEFVERMKVDFGQLEQLGQVQDSWGFGMTPFALRTASFANGVSKLHGEVSREMWGSVLEEGNAAPIGHITNGVHARTFLSHELTELLVEVGVRFGKHPSEQGWEKVREIDDARLWDVRRSRKERLLETGVRRYLRQPGAKASEWRFDPDVLTIGFARRFATYKRAGLLFSDPERLARIIGNADRPVQILLAGKAHPADVGGKDLIQQVVHYSRDERAHGRIAFLEDYEIVLARRLVQGVDVWLNTPRRPMEASGTSGMKASMNGGLNASILDGWWAEGYALAPETGFAIGGEWVDSNDAVQDQKDAEALYSVLENEVIPAYYERDESGLPKRWIHMMKESIALLGPQFSADRMVEEYTSTYYMPAHRAASERSALAASQG